MALRQASGYALRSRPLGEADLIVDLYTRERGRVRVVARSARRLKSRFGSAFEPFTRSRVVWYQKDRDDLGRASSCEIDRSYFEALSGVENAALAGYMAELLIGFTPEHDPSEPLYRLVGAVLDAVAAGGEPELLARYFECWLLRLSGLLPDVDHCAACGRSLASEAWISEPGLELICSRGCGGQGGRRRLTAGARTLLKRILRERPADLAREDLPRAEVRALGAVMEVLICGHLDRAPRSLRVLRRLQRQAGSPPPAGMIQA